jgi:hypothetical protein
VPIAKAEKCTTDDVLPIAGCKSMLAEYKADAFERFRETSPDGRFDKIA